MITQKNYIIDLGNRWSFCFQSSSFFQSMYSIKIFFNFSLQRWREKKNYQDYPDYYDIIQDPIDLSEILKKTRIYAYRSVEDFRNDLEKMHRNCAEYCSEKFPGLVDQARKLVNLAKFVSNGFFFFSYLVYLFLYVKITPSLFFWHAYLLLEMKFTKTKRRFLNWKVTCI